MKKNNKVVKTCLIFIIFIMGMFLYFDFQNFKENSVPVFEYHRVENLDDIYTIKPEVFKAQMEYLHDLNYKSISVKELVLEMKKANPDLKNKMIISFDDGYVDNLTQASVIMDKYGYRGTIFVAIKFMAWPGYVTWQDLISLQDKGWEIGSHSWNHVHLDELNAKQLKKELKDSKIFLETFIPNTFKTVDTFSYPNGVYDEKIVLALKKYGYLGAVTGDKGVNTKDTNPYMLHRINISQEKNGLFRFKIKLEIAQLRGWLKTFSVNF